MADIVDLAMAAESNCVNSQKTWRVGGRRDAGVDSKYISFFPAFYSMQDPRLRDVNVHLRI